MPLDENPEAQSNTQPSSGDAMVDVHQADRASLDAALANAQAQEAEESTATDESPAQPAQPEQTPNGQSASDGAGVATQGAEPSKPAVPATQDDIQGLRAENERLKTQGNQKELFIQHRGNELGTLKQQLANSRRDLATMKAQLTNGLEDRFAENPVQASNDRDRIKEIDTQLEGLDSQEERATKIVEAQTFFLRHVDTEKVNLDDVSDVLKADGVDERFIAQFKANPWEFTTPEALVQMGKRAMDRKQFVTADSDRRILAKHVLAQQQEIAQLKTKPGRVMAQVQKNLNRAPSVTAASAASTRGARDINPEAITKMSRAELDAALKASMN